jgi:3-phenylpropionate/trans-cinnamate dioxygenase ferredoxin reductase subunit
VPTDYLPELRGDDTVYVAGPPGLVDAVKAKARAAQAPCYADPFLPGTQRLSLGDRLMQMFHRSGEPTLSAPDNAKESVEGTG